MVFFIFGIIKRHPVEVLRDFFHLRWRRLILAVDEVPLKYCLFIEKYDIHPISYRVFVE